MLSCGEDKTEPALEKISVCERRVPSVVVRPEGRGDGSIEAVENGKPETPVTAEYVGNVSENEAIKEELAGHTETPIVMMTCPDATESIGNIAMSLV